MRVLTIPIEIITSLDEAGAITNVSKIFNGKFRVERTHVMREDVMT